MRRLVTLIALLLTVIACSNGTDTAVQPAELIRIDAAVEIQSVWRTSLGDAGDELFMGIVPATDGTAVFAAALDGEVIAVSVADGDRLWRVDTDSEIAAGPGVGEGLVVVAGPDGAITVLSATDGSVRWRADVAGEVLAAPAVGQGRVVIRISDGRVVALDSLSGELLWRIERETPSITLRGNAAPVIVGERVLIGTDAGKVLAARLEDGRLIWETPIAIPQGATIIERMVDVDASPVTVGSDVFAISYQGRAAMLGLESGQVFWAVDADSYRSPAVDSLSIFISDSDGVVHRLDRRSGTPRWEQAALLARTLTGPVLHAESLVVGDFEGYVHWLSPEDGSLQGRARAGSDSVLDPMLVVGDLVIAQTRDGKLAAFQIASD
jgi:outer membrane protein assembly factor BamB